MLTWPTIAIGFAGSVAIGGLAMDARAEAPQQAQAAAAQPVETNSLDRLRRELDREPGLKLELQIPVATFQATVEERQHMPTFEEGSTGSSTSTRSRRSDSNATRSAGCSHRAPEPEGSMWPGLSGRAEHGGEGRVRGYRQGIRVEWTR
jgi:hypothetical protein